MTRFTGWGSSWGGSWGLIASIQAGQFSAEVEINVRKPRKHYVKRRGKLFLFNSAEEADDWMEADDQAEEAIKKAQISSRRSKIRVRNKVITVKPIETVDIPGLYSQVKSLGLDFNIPALIKQQEFDKVMQVMALAQQMQDEDDEEILLLLG